MKVDIEVTDTEIIDWIEENIIELDCFYTGGFNHEEWHVYGKDDELFKGYTLREALINMIQRKWK
jgi:hypothetical protein